MQCLHTPMSSFSSHRRKNSGELDVFEATRYFSGGTDMAPPPGRAVRGGYRMSLDMPIDAKVPTRVDLLNSHIKEKVIKCNKQPSSPGGRLATFINSFFQHYSASKKKKASKKGEEISGRSMRMSTTTCHYSSSCTSTSTSAFRTPSLNSISKKREDQHQGFSSNYNKDHEDHNWGGDHELKVKMRLGDDQLKNLKNNIKGQEINIKGFRDDDDEGGVSTDSSSDLFELKNYHEFGDEMSSGLPVYGSTDMGVIRRRAGSYARTVAY